MDTQPLEDTRNASPRTAVIILNWNGLALLRRYLPAVIATTDAAISRIIVADNGSTDDSVEYIKNEFGDRVEIMSFDHNYGFAEGYNRAVSLAGGYEYVVLLNSDVATTPGWDRVLLEYMDSHGQCGACQPKLLSDRQRDTFEYAGACGGYLDCNGYPYCRGRIFADCEKDHGQYDTVRDDLHWASGACLMIRRKFYLDAGGLDARFFAHMEEIDLCWRIRLAGYTLAVVPQAVAYHLGGGSLPAENPRKTYLNFRNNLLMLHKNLPDDDRSRILFVRRLLDTVAFAKYLLTFDFANAKAILKAHGDFRKMRCSYTRHPSENLLSGSPYSRLSILWQYYIRCRRHFSQLKPKPR